MYRPSLSYGIDTMLASESSRKGDDLGFKNPAQRNCASSSLDICPDIVVAAFGAALASGFAVLYTLITAAGRRRRKRRRRSDLNTSSTPVYSFMTLVLQDLLWSLGTLRLYTVLTQNILVAFKMSTAYYCTAYNYHPYNYTRHPCNSFGNSCTLLKNII